MVFACTGTPYRVRTTYFKVLLVLLSTEVFRCLLGIFRTGVVVLRQVGG